MRIYLDVCCLNRPFDDQTQDRIHLETEAILTIMKFVENGEWKILNSDAILYEISKIPDEERKAKVRFIVSQADEFIKVNEHILERTKQIVDLGVKTYDALHIACAEEAGADVFLTTDDKLLKKTDRHANKVKIKIRNPLDWIREVI